jgi:hypothetical protein
VLSATLRTAFPYVARDPIEPTNSLVIASTRPLTGRRAGARAAAGALRRWRARRGAARAGLRGGDGLHDDAAPVEWLVDTSIVHYAAEGGAVIQACSTSARKGRAPGAAALARPTWRATRRPAWRPARARCTSIRATATAPSRSSRRSSEAAVARSARAARGPS